jgi:signal transduction histidine kinase
MSAPSDTLVLVIEDRAEVNQLISEALSSDYGLMFADTEAAGIAAAREHDPDLVIADLTPASAGVAVVQAIRTDPMLMSTPILVLSAAGDRSRIGLLRAGANDYIVKPFALDELHARVDNLVARHKAEQRLNRLRLSDDRDRIARDLHDVVIQRLFAIGMRLDAAAKYAVHPVVQERITETVHDLDDVIKDIRSTIFDLQHGTEQDTFRTRVRALATEAGERIGVKPRVTFEGAVDTLIDGQLAANALAVIQESLSNTVRHAYASSIEVDVTATREDIMITVTDDGVGPSDKPTTGHGLRNMASRAEALGGSFSIAPNEPLGTKIIWRVPRS